MLIAHTADLHLGYRQYGLPERQDDYLVASAYIFKKAIELGVNVIHLGGDIFHSVHPPANAVFYLHSLAKQAIDAGIMVVGIDGNHDSTETAWLRVCNVTPLEQWNADGSLVIHTTNGSGVNFAGLNGDRPQNLRAKIDKVVAGAKARGERIDIFSLHIPIAEMAGFEGVDMSARDVAAKLAPIGVRCVLLGDIHDYKETVFGGVRFIYSGSPEMTALDEQEQKTFSIVDVTPDTLKTSVVPTPARSIVHQHADVVEDLDTVLANVKTATADPRRPPLVVLTYDPAVAGLRQKAEGLLKGRALARVVPLPSGQNLDIFGQVAERKDAYERKGAMRNLKEVVTTRFGEERDEFGLIVSCIEKPDQIEEILLQYAKAKGLEISP